MRRVLAILFLLFAHSWPLRIMSAFALLSVALGVFVGSRDITNNFVLLITLLWSGGAFRQVVSDSCSPIPVSPRTSGRRVWPPDSTSA
jgi:hypothetical protein